MGEVVENLEESATLDLVQGRAGVRGEECQLREEAGFAQPASVPVFQF